MSLKTIQQKMELLKFHHTLPLISQLHTEAAKEKATVFIGFF